MRAGGYVNLPCSLFDCCAPPVRVSPLARASPDRTGFLGRATIRVAFTRLGMSRFFAATASPAIQSLRPELFFFARSRADAGATRFELSLGVGLPTRRAFRLGGPSSVTRSDVPCHPDTPLRACTPCGMRCDPGASVSRTAACPSRADLAAVADPMNLPFPPSQDSLRRARFRCSSLAIRNAFDWSSIPFCGSRCGAVNVFGQSHRSCSTLSPIAAARTVTCLPGCHAGLTLLPFAALPRLLVELPCSRRVRDARF